MKIAIFFVLSAMLYTSNSAGQQPTIAWQRSFGGTQNEMATSARQTADGGYIITGLSTSADGDVTANRGSYDYWVVKVSPTGAIQWQKSVGGSGSDEPYSVVETKDSGYIVAGRSESNDSDVAGNHGNFDGWIVKFSAGGTVEWEKTIGGSRDDGIYAIQQTMDSGYVIAACSKSSDIDASVNRGDYDYWIVKLSPTGSIQWERSFGGSRSDIAYAIRQTPDSGYIVAGTSNSPDGDVTHNHGDYDYLILKLSPLGTLQWEKSFGGSGDDEPNAIVPTTDNGYLVAGYSNSNDGDIENNLGNYDYWILKLSASGTVLWQKSFGGTGADQAWSAEMTLDGGYVISGNTNSTNGDVTRVCGNDDYWIVGLTAGGSLAWQRSLGGSEDEEAYYTVPTADSGYLVVGAGNSADSDASVNHGGSDFWVVKLNKEPKAETGISTTTVQAITILPNPATDDIYLSGSEPMDMRLYSCIGQLVMQDTHCTHMRVNSLPTGTYILRVYDEGGLMVKQEKIEKLAR